MAEPVRLSDDTFEEIVLKAQIPVLVDFWATWCAPCRMIAPIIEELAEEYNGKIQFAKLDVNDNPKMATKYGIESIPALIIFKQGEPFKQIVGFKPKKELKQSLDAALQ